MRSSGSASRPAGLLAVALARRRPAGSGPTRSTHLRRVQCHGLAGDGAEPGPRAHESGTHPHVGGARDAGRRVLAPAMDHFRPRPRGAPRRGRLARAPGRARRDAHLRVLGGDAPAALRVVDQAFAGAPHLICYSVKANGNLALLRSLRRWGSGFDVVSGGELARVLEAGGDPGRTVFAGVGKTEPEMAFALRAGIVMFNVESAEELEALDRVGRRLRRRAPFAIRVNPDVDARTHRHISTGLTTSKFGVPFDEARGALRPRPSDARRPGPRRRLPHRQPAHPPRSAGRGAPAGGGAVPRARGRGAPARAGSTSAAGSASATRTRSRRRPTAGPRPCARPRASPGPRCWSSRAGCWWATPACSSRACSTGSGPAGEPWSSSTRG